MRPTSPCAGPSSASKPHRRSTSSSGMGCRSAGSSAATSLPRPLVALAETPFDELARGPRASSSAGVDSGGCCCGVRGYGQDLHRTSSLLQTVVFVLFDFEKRETVSPVGKIYSERSCCQAHRLTRMPANPWSLVPQRVKQRRAVRALKNFFVSPLESACCSSRSFFAARAVCRAPSRVRRGAPGRCRRTRLNPRPALLRTHLALWRTWL